MAQAIRTAILVCECHALVPEFKTNSPPPPPPSPGPRPPLQPWHPLNCSDLAAMDMNWNPGKPRIKNPDPRSRPQEKAAEPNPSPITRPRWRFLVAGKGGGAPRERGWPPQMQPRAYSCFCPEFAACMSRRFVEPGISTDLLILGVRGGEGRGGGGGWIWLADCWSCWHEAWQIHPHLQSLMVTQHTCDGHISVLHRYSLSRPSILRILIRPIRTQESHTAATRWYVATQPTHLDQTTQNAILSLKPSPPSCECNNSCRDKKRHSATRGSNDIRQSAWPLTRRPRQTDRQTGVVAVINVAG